jgi:hypothetical protein
MRPQPAAIASRVNVSHSEQRGCSKPVRAWLYSMPNPAGPVEHSQPFTNCREDPGCGAFQECRIGRVQCEAGGGHEKWCLWPRDRAIVFYRYPRSR